MKSLQHPLRRLAIVGLLFSFLAGCAVVPYGPPRYYDHPERIYGPPVVVPLPLFHPRYHGHHWHHGHRGPRGHRGYR
jgi:hypothetical protein